MVFSTPVLRQDPLSFNQGILAEKTAAILKGRMYEIFDESNKIQKISTLAIPVLLFLTFLFREALDNKTLKIQNYEAIGLDRSKGYLSTTLITGCFIAAIVALYKNQQRKEIQIKKLIDKLDSQYKSETVIDDHDLLNAIGFCKISQTEKIFNKMNFRQLALAKKNISTKTFKQICTKKQTLELKLWNYILSLPWWKSSDSWIKKLKSSSIRFYIETSPLFKQAAKEHFSSHSRSIPDELKLTPFESSNLPSTKIEVLSEDGQSFFVEKEQVTKNCQFFSALFNSGFSESQSKKIQIKNLSSQVLKPFLDFLNGNPPEITPKNIYDLLFVAERLNSTRMTVFLDKYLVNNVAFFEEESLLELVENFPALKNLKTHIENKYLSKKLDDKNWEKTFFIAQKIKSSALKIKCEKLAKNRLEEKLKMTDSPLPWLEFAAAAMPSQDFYKIIEDNLCLENLKLFFDHGKKTENSTLIEHLLSFCSDHITTLREANLWEFDDTPKEIASIIYTADSLPIEYVGLK